MAVLQAYVALSRATNLDGLRLVNFKPAAVKAHVKVVEFYRGLTDVAPGFALASPSSRAEEPAARENPHLQSSGQTDTWEPSRSPLKPWVCPGFGGGAGPDGWIMRADMPTKPAEDTWMDCGSTSTGSLTHVYQQPRALYSPQQHPARLEDKVHRRPSANTFISDHRGAGTWACSSAPPLRKPPVVDCRPKNPEQLVTKEKMDRFFHNASGSKERRPDGHGNTGTRIGEPEVAASRGCAHAAQPSNSAKGANPNAGGGLSSEQRARIDSNRAKAMALKAAKGKRLPY